MLRCVSICDKMSWWTTHLKNEYTYFENLKKDVLRALYYCKSNLILIFWIRLYKVFITRSIGEFLGEVLSPILLQFCECSYFSHLKLVGELIKLLAQTPRPAMRLPTIHLPCSSLSVSLLFTLELSWIIPKGKKGEERKQRH